MQDQILRLRIKLIILIKKNKKNKKFLKNGGKAIIIKHKIFNRILKHNYIKNYKQEIKN